MPQAGGLTQPYVGHPQRLYERIGRGRHTLVGYIDSGADQFASFVDGSRAMHAALGLCRREPC